MEMEKSYASKGVANTGLGFGIAGTALGLMGGLGNALFNNMGGGCAPVCSESTPVNRYELNLTQEIASKDAKIGLLESQVYVDQKLVDVVKDYTSQINSLRDTVQANKEAQCAINTQQAVYNGTMNATLNCIQGQIAQLFGLTKLVVPNTSVCPGWGNVTITPAAATTTTPAA